MNIFVTGGAGYVGSHCVRRLLEAGHGVTVFDNLSAGHKPAVPRGARFVHGDLSDAAYVADLLALGRFDAVMHFAAMASVGESVEQPLRYYRSNIGCAVNLLDAMQRAGLKRLVFSSTCAVYGVPAKLPITEDTPKSPINPYGHTKLAIEWLLESCAAAWGLGAIALRYFNAAGCAADGSLGEDHRPEAHLIPLVLDAALGKRPAIRVFGADYPTPDGSCVRDYVHVDDLAEAHRLALDACAGGSTQAFNVGTGRGHSVLEVISAARAVTGQAIPVEQAERRPGDPPTLFADATRIGAALGWRPHHVELGPIIASAWNWRRAHPNGYDR